MAERPFGDQPPRSTWCGGCQGPARASCTGSLAHAGVLKAHWESWSDCNLHCPFCFRTHDDPLDTQAGKGLIDAVSTGGIRSIAFAGGDPSLRSDIGVLVRHAKMRTLSVEIQTNAHIRTPQFWDAILLSDRVCLSIDGPTEALHDSIRRTRGNLKRVIHLAKDLEAMGKPITIRSVVTLENISHIPDIAAIVRRLSNCETWTVLEFTPVNEGYIHRAQYDPGTSAFEVLASKLASEDLGDASLDIFRTRDKVGAYCQLTASGSMYGATQGALLTRGHHDMIGSIMTDHLDELSAKLPFLKDRHQERYGRVAEFLPSNTSSG